MVKSRYSCVSSVAGMPIIIMMAAGAIFVARAVASDVSMLMAYLKLVRIRSTGLLLMKSNGISSSIQIIL